MKVCDLQERFGVSELHSMDETENKVKIIGYEEAKASFPNVVLSQSENVCYFPFKLCHSIPKVNSRGRTYMPAVLQKSFPSLMDQVLDYEHQLVDNKTSNQDRIIGHVKSVRFDGQIPLEMNARNLPKEPMPVIGLGCLYKRAYGVNKILQQTGDKPSLWRVSMECNHDWNDAYFWYGREEFIPISDASEEMIDCIGKDYVKPYKGRELAVCIGGMDKELNFLGAALTTNPADTDADILGFVTGMNRELCSRKIFHMPICPLTGKAREVADAGSQKIKELSSIAILGWTEEGGMDKHKHMILSDGTVMPEHGHHHCMKTWTINPGRKATLSGVTEVNHDYVRNTEGERMTFVHNHLFNIDLIKKASAVTGASEPSTNNGVNDMPDYSMNDLASATVTIGESEMKLQDLMKEFAKELATASAATGAKPDELKPVLLRLGDLADKFRELNADEEIKSRISEEIDKRVASGQLITKEKADAAVAEAQAKATETVELEKKRLELIQKRREKCREAGINLDFQFDGLTNSAGQPMTVGDRVDNFGVDEQGEREFLYNFGLWKKIAEDGAEKEKEGEKPVVTTTPAKEAASARKQTMHLAGGGPSGEENNNTDPWIGFGSKPSSVRKDNGGVHLLTR